MPLTNLVGPKKYDLRIIRGDSFNRTIRLKEDGVAVPLTGYQARAQIRDKVNGRVLADFDIDLTDLVNGTFDISLTTTQTRELLATGVWDLEIWLTADPESNNHTILSGIVTVVDDVTRVPAP